MGLRWVGFWALGMASAVAQESPGSITGTVVDVTSEGLPGADVIVQSPTAMATETDAAGKFVIAGLTPGAYTLRIQKTGFLAKDLGVSVEAGTETPLGRVALEVKALGPCLGKPKKPRISETKLPHGDGKSKVVGSAHVAGFALSGLTITLLVASTPRIVAATSTGKNGEFQFEDVKPGDYDLEISSETSTLRRVPNLRVKEDHELELRLSWTDPGICL